MNFEEFCKLHGIRLSHSPPYHPQSNGLAERTVQSVKCNLKKLLIDCKSNESIENKLSKTLLFMRNTPCVKTGVSPASIVLKQSPRTKLSMLRPEFNRKVCSKEQSKEIPLFKIGDSVFVRSIHDKLVKWWPGIIVDKKSPTSYFVRTGNRERFYHVGEIKRNLCKKASEVGVTEDDRSSLERPLAEALLPETESCVNQRADVMVKTPVSPNCILDKTPVKPVCLKQSVCEKKIVAENLQSGCVVEPPALRRSQRQTSKPVKYPV